MISFPPDPSKCQELEVRFNTTARGKGCILHWKDFDRNMFQHHIYDQTTALGYK